MGVVERLRSEFGFIQGNYLVLVLSWIIMDFGREIPETYYALYLKGLGATPATIGLIGSASFVALAAVQFPGGYMADRFGRRWLISTMTFTVAFSYLFYALAPSWHFILIGAVIQSLCLIYQPALGAMISDTLPPERRGMGFSIIMLISRASTTPGPLLAGLFFATFGLIDGMRLAYTIVFVLFFAAAVLRLRLTETVEETESVSRGDILRAYPSALREGIAVWKRVPRSMVFLFLQNLIGSFSFAMVFPFFVLYAVEELGIPELIWPFVLLVLSISMIVSALPVGKIVDMSGRKIPLLLSQGVFLVAMLLFVYGDLYRLVLAMVFFGMAVILSNASYGSLRTDLVPQKLRGKVIGSAQFFEYILMALGAFVGGLVYETISPRLPFFLLVLLLAPQAAVIAWFVHEPETRED